MPLINTLVQQTSTSTGTGNLTLSTILGRQSFPSAYPPGVALNQFVYYASNPSANEWESGLGHMSDSITMVRDTIFSSSTGGAPINFSNGTKDIVNDFLAPSVRTYISGASPAISITDVYGRIYVALTTPAPLNLPLPAISGFPTWTPINIKLNGNISGTNTVTLTPNGADTFEGNASLVMDLPFAQITIMSDGTQWVAE